MYLRRATISAELHCLRLNAGPAVMLAAESLAIPVFLTHALMALATSGMHLLIWKKTELSSCE